MSPTLDLKRTRTNGFTLAEQSHAIKRPRGPRFSTADPGTGEAFASCGEGVVTVVKETSPGKFEVTQTVKTRQGAKTLALDPTTHTLVREGKYVYDPQNYHGPTLYFFSSLIPWLARFFGGVQARDAYGLTTFNIRLVTALFGIATI